MFSRTFVCAVTLPRNGYETRGPQRPVLLVGNMPPPDPASCDSPSKIFNVSAVSAAARSEYTPAVFRCEPAPGSYEFAIEYNP